MRPLFAYIRAGYDRRSLYALVALAVTYAAVGVVFNHLIDLSRGMDWLLGGIWAFMTLTLLWGFDVRRDVRLAAVAFAGGLVIEWWGTTTSIWTYYTDERPPIWILPAWPVAALTIERLAMVTERAFPRRLPAAPLWWVAFPGFVAWMTHFAWPSVGTPSTYVIVALMLGVLATSTDRRRDLAILVAGTLLGVFLEYWGTSRWCWRYYTKEVPPPVAAVAHGFASVAFARGVWAAEKAWAWRVGRRPGPDEAPVVPG
ncbi:MAG: hypothetical protein Q8P41_22510 [Pseudomonadota bacterium]|nr:hypothetical protein [Pseudomonadota bacterium]